MIKKSIAKIPMFILTSVLICSLPACGRNGQSSQTAGSDKTQAVADGTDKTQAPGSGTDKTQAPGDGADKTQAPGDGNPSGGSSDVFSPEYIIEFDGIAIKEFPFDISVLKDKGYEIEYSSSGKGGYALKGNEKIRLMLDENSKESVCGIQICNDNYGSGNFDVGKISLFGTIPLAQADGDSILKIIDPKGNQKDGAYKYKSKSQFNYSYDFYEVKGCDEFGYMRENETDFSIFIKIETGSSGENPSASENPGGGQERPNLVDERVYEYWDDGDALHWISVKIYDTGGWSLGTQSYMGSGEAYVDYGYAQEAAGEYVLIKVYTFNDDGSTDSFTAGPIRLTMTDDLLCVFYEGDDEPIEYYRNRE